MEINKKITLTAYTKADDGSVIVSYTGNIDTKNPDKLGYNPAILDQKLYRQNRTQAKKDQEAFEDALYAEQEKLLQEAGGNE